MMPVSIRARITLSMMAGIFGFLLLASFVIDRLVEGFVDAEVVQELKRSCDAYALFDDTRDALLVDKARTLARAPHLRAVLDTPEVDEETVAFALEAMADAVGEQLVLVADGSGRVVFRSGSNIDSVVDQPGASSVLDGGVYSGLWHESERSYVVAVSPVTLADTVLGLLAIGAPVDTDYARLLGRATSQDVTFIRGGRAIAHTCQSSRCVGLEQPLGGPENWEAIGPFTISRIVVGGAEHIATAIPIDDGRARVLLSRPLNEALTSFHAAKREMILIACLVASCAFLVSRRLAAHIAQPIQDLRVASENMAAGDLATRVHVSGHDELGTLGESFNGMASRMEGLVEDVTEKARAAEEASRAKAHFLSTMSHELRTPLNGILGFSQVLGQSQLSKEQNAHLAIVERSGRDLLRLIDDILAFAEIEAGKVDPEPIAFHLPTSIERALEGIRERAAKKGLELTIEIAESVPRRLVGDVHRLCQSLKHLAENAVKFTLQGSVRVEVEVQSEEAGEVVLEFAVTDTGIGIPLDRHDELFEAFTQVDSSPSRAHGGAGLGLALTREYVRLLHGECRCESTPGVGSTFHFSARFEKEATYVDLRGLPPDSGASGAGSAQHAADGASKRILIVEDNPANQRLVSVVVSRAGWKYRLAANGAECLKQFDGEHFDLILMDCQMPVMDGFEATRAIRERELDRGGHVPVIAVTANTQEGGREACHAAGMDGYLAKPFHPSALVQSIEAWLGAPT
ncbi:MAG: response regulator [bacterium]|nr:response regulator [bacterium]